MEVGRIKKLLDKIMISVNLVQLFLRYQPQYLLYITGKIIFASVLPLLEVYAPKLIIEKLMDGSKYSEIVEVVCIYGVILLFVYLMRNYMSDKSSLCANKFSNVVRYEIGKMVMDLEIKDIEGGSSKEIIIMANNISAVTGIMNVIQNIISSSITTIGLTLIVIQLDGLFLLLVAFSLLIKITFTYLRFLKMKKLRQLHAANDKVGNYLTNVAYFNEGGAKEIRVNSLSGWFLKKNKEFRDQMVSIQYKDFIQYSIFEIITLCVLALQSFLVLWVLSQGFLNGTVTIGEFTMYFTAISSLTITLSGITEQILNYNQQVMNMKDYNKLVRLSIEHNDGVGDASDRNVNNNANGNTDIHIDNNTISHNDSDIICHAERNTFSMTDKGNTEISFHNVSFVYPNTEKVVLEYINITIKNGEKLVIVGLNGAGKSTFIKLLCKFYRPTTGIITLNGIDIWNIPNTEYYKLISAVFQDYTNFAFSIYENVAMSEKIEKNEKLAKNENQTSVSDALAEVGLKQYIDELPDGVDTNITNQFSSKGVELSGGQGQKIAITRAIYKNTPIFILDEPTASLDVKAESEIYTDFFHLSKNKTTIFISHRLAVSTIADKIAVFDHGKIVEYGSHNDLVKRNNLYAKMYIKQSNSY